MSRRMIPSAAEHLLARINFFSDDDQTARIEAVEPGHLVHLVVPVDHCMVTEGGRWLDDGEECSAGAPHDCSDVYALVLVFRYRRRKQRWTKDQDLEFMLNGEPFDPEGANDEIKKQIEHMQRVLGARGKVAPAKSTGSAQAAPKTTSVRARTTIARV